MKKNVLLPLLLITPLLASCNEEYGYDLTLNANNAVDLETMGVQVFKEDDSEVTSGYLSSFTSYIMKLTYTGTNTSSSELEKYSIEVSGISSVSTITSLLKASTASTKVSDNDIICEYTSGKTAGKEVNESIEIEFQLQNSIDVSQTISCFHYSFSNCTMDQLISSAAVSSKTVSKFSNNRHQYLKFGYYIQDADTDIEESILWRVLEHNEDNDYYLVMSEYILDYDTLSNAEELISDYVFEDDLVDVIEYGYGMSLTDALNTEYGFAGTDANDIERQAYVTDYAKSKGISCSKAGTADYWINTATAYTDTLYYKVKKDGSIGCAFALSTSGTILSFLSSKCGIRPYAVIRIKEGS